MFGRKQIIFGAVLGVVVAAVILAWDRAGRAAPPQGIIVSECEGALKELVIQYEPGALEDIAPIYRDFLRQLSADVIVHVACPDRVAFDQLREAVGKVPCTLQPVITGHPQTAWARDRWVALVYPGGAVHLASAPHEVAGTVWPARAGDERIGEDLAQAIPGVSFQRSELYFDGGDVLATPRHAIVTSRLLPRNIGKTVRDAAELKERMERLLGRPVLLLDGAPDHHVAMFMMAADKDTMLVGDPSLANKISTPSDCARWALPEGADFSADTQKLFDAVADQCARAGYRVVRIPVAPGGDGRTYLTYTNVLIDQPGGKRIVYMPIYHGAEALNEAAAAVWKGLGFEVRPVDCTGAYRHFGCLHCLVNVLRRGD